MKCFNQRSVAEAHGTAVDPSRIVSLVDENFNGHKKHPFPAMYMQERGSFMYAERQATLVAFCGRCWYPPPVR